MPNASFRVLKDWFVNHLHFTPTPSDVDRFEADLKVVSPSLMKASLVELSIGKSRLPPRLGAWRHAIFAVYNRKVAEHAQLFPMLHCFETAFRSTAAVALEEHYATPRWWDPVRVFVEGGPAVSRIGNVTAVTSDRLRSIRLLVEELSTSNPAVLRSAKDGYELLDATTLGQVKRLITAHWPVFKPMFVRNGQLLKPDSFGEMFDHVSAARNAVYHHNSFAGMAAAYNSAANLLSYLGFPLARVHKAIAVAPCAKPDYFPRP